MMGVVRVEVLMRRFGLLIGIGLALASCSQSSSSGTAVTTNTVALSPTTASEVDGDDAVGAELPTVVFDRGFSPTNVDLSSSLEVRFVNSSAGAVVIVFDSEHLPDISLIPGGEVTAGFGDVPLDIYRFHAEVGGQRIPGTVDSRYFGLAEGQADDPALPDPPDAMHFELALPTTEVLEFGVSPLGQEAGVAAIRLTVPAGWSDLSMPGQDAYLFLRRAAANDPAEVLFRPTYVGASIASELDFISEQAGIDPEDLGQLIIRGQEWSMYHWSPDDGPYETLLARSANGIVGLARLSSAPEDHSTLFESVLIPMVSTSELVLAEE